MSDLTRITTSVYALPPTGDPALLLFFCTSTNKPGHTVSLSDAWSTFSGYLIVVPQQSTGPDLANLAAAIAAFPAFVAPPATSFAWTSWDGESKRLAADPTIVLVTTASGSPRIAATIAVAAGRYGVWMQGGSPITAVNTGGDIDHFTIVYTPQEGWPASNGIGCTIPMTGGNRFCVAAEGLIGDPSSDPHAGFDISLCYATALASARYPVFEAFPAGYHILTELVFDPLMLFGAAGYAPRTIYSLASAGFTIANDGGTWVLSTAPPPVLVSNYRGVFGQKATLQPLTGSGLVPQPLPEGGWCLVPSGPFALGLPAAGDGTTRLLCGTSGTEFIDVSAAAYVMTFVPDSNAFEPAAGGALTSQNVTAWVAIGPANPGLPAAAYYAQPASNALFGGGTSASVLPLADALLCDINPIPAFPLAPYGGVAEAFDFATFESKVLAPQRKAALITASGNIVRNSLAATSGSVTATTPQGFLVDVSGITWTNLQLANDGTNVLQIATVPDALRVALQSPDLFLVMTLPIDASAGYQPNIAIAQWPFQLDVGRSPPGGTGMDRFGNVLIFKFGKGSVRDGVGAGPAAWTDAATFNDSAALDKLHSWLETYLDDAIDSTDPAFAAFASRVQDPAWNGALALRVTIGDELPGNIEGILAGIDASKFYAHHVGITMTQITASPASPPPSSLFGLIDYVDLDPSSTVTNRPPPTADPSPTNAYSFRVLTVLAEFANSQIVTFESVIVLTVTQLFGEGVQLQQAGGKTGPQQSSITFNGHMETHNGATVYTFTTGVLSRFLFPASKVFSFIDVVNANFQTLGQSTSGTPPVTTVTSRFSFRGNFSFLPTGGIDIFSFGSDPATPEPPPSALAYSNLGVVMTFDLAEPQQSVAFTFDTGSVAFDVSLSTPRPNSTAVTLFTALPLKLDTILSGTDVLPQNNGYFQVVSEDITGVQGLLPAQWYGLGMRINLGTMGALASLAAFDAELIAAWSPGGDAQHASLLMKLPGTSPGKTGLSLQGVLHLGIGEITAAVDGTSVSLTFSDVGLDFLGVLLPRGAAIEVALVGNSDAVTTSSLGWLASYTRTSS